MGRATAAAAAALLGDKLWWAVVVCFLAHCSSGGGCPSGLLPLGLGGGFRLEPLTVVLRPVGW